MSVTAKPPLCRYCGKPIAKAARTVWIETNPAIGGKPTNWSRYVHVAEGAEPTSKEACAPLTNQHVISVSYTKRKNFEDNEYDRRVVRSFSEWDGVSYKDPFFCNGDHARRFAYAVLRTPAYKNVAMPAYIEAVSPRPDVEVA